MSKTTKGEKQALVPRLRFPDFRDAGEWREAQLGELGEFTGGGTPSKSNDSFWKGSIPWVSSSDISEDSIHDIRISRFITEEALKSSATKLVPEGSILLVSRVGVGKLAIPKSAVCTSQDFINLTPCNDDLVFLGYLLKANARALEGLGQGMAIKGFTKEDITKLTVYLPELEEQQKIADCLSSLDVLIAAQADKIDALKTHKKGLMQQLFPREGETVPRLRFPEFRDAGEWEEKPLSDCCHLQAGKFVRASDIHQEFSSERYPCYGGNGLRGYTETFTHKGQYPLIGRQGAQCGNVNLVNGKFHATEHAVVVTAKQGVDIVWLFYKLIRMDLNQHATGQAQPGLSVENLDKLTVRIPENEKEQQKIADILRSLDELIAANTERLDVLKAHEKGLMQQLFPIVEGVVS